MKKTLRIVLLRALQGAVLAAFVTVVWAAPHLVGRRDPGARVAQARADILCISAALSTYQVDHDEYPATEQGLQALVVRPSGPAAKSWKGPYGEAGAVPKDPWGNDYVYRRSGTGHVLFSSGPDGIAGTGDDVRS